MIRMRLASSGLLAIVVGLVALASLSNVFASHTPRDLIASQKVIHYKDSARDLLQAINDVAIKLDIPVGAELNGQLPVQEVSIEVSDGTVSNVFDAIVGHAPDYKWVEQNGVIDIMPKENANSVLDLKISHFKVHDATPNYIRTAIASLPEVKAWLSQNQIVERSLIAGSILIGSDGKTNEPRLSLERRNVTLREIMNNLVVRTKKSGQGGWSFSRYGESNKYLNISID